MSYQALLKEFFLGDISEMRQLMKELTESERKNLFKQFTPLVDALSKGFRYNKEPHFFHAQFDQENFLLTKLYQLYQTEPDNFLKLNWLRDEKSANPHEFRPYGFTFRDLYNRLRALEVGLGNQRTAERGLKYKTIDPYTFYDISRSNGSLFNSGQLILEIGTILLDRSEDWKKTIFFNLCINLEKWNDSLVDGFAQLLVDAMTSFPEWQSELQQYFGKAMLLDGFRQPQWYKKFPLEMITAGFVMQQMPTVRYRRSYQLIPILNYNLVEEIVRQIKAEQLPRWQFIEIAFRELINPHQQAEMRGWIDFYQKLDLDLAEKAEFSHQIIDLINSINNEAIKIGLKEAAELWQNGYLNGQEIIDPLCLAMQNRQPAIAIGAQKLLKSVTAKDNIEVAAIVPSLIDALNSPHDKLRLAVIKWLNQLKAKLSYEHLQQLAETAESLAFN